MIKNIRMCRSHTDIFMLFAAQKSDKKVNAIAYQEACGIENQVIDIADPVKEGKLQNFNHQGKTETCRNHLPVAVKAFVYGRPDDTKRDKHGCVSNEIQKGFLPGGIVKQVDKGAQIEPERAAVF